MASKNINQFHTLGGSSTDGKKKPFKTNPHSQETEVKPSSKPKLPAINLTSYAANGYGANTNKNPSYAVDDTFVDMTYAGNTGSTIPPTKETVDTSYAGNTPTTETVTDNINTGAVSDNSTTFGDVVKSETEATEPTYAEGTVGESTGEGGTENEGTNTGEAGEGAGDTSGSTGDIGENAGETAKTEEPIYSYLDYLNSLPSDLQEIYNDTIANIDAQNKAMLEEIEAARKREIVDASTSYEQNKSSYGAKAEALASMGLTGGGYSEYMDAQAYATQRAEVQGANSNAANLTYAANSEAATKKAEAKTALNEAIVQNNKDTATYKEGIYTTFLEGAGNGTYTAEQIEELATLYSLSDAQRASLLNAANTYTEGKGAEDDAALKSTSATNYQSVSEKIKADPDAYTEADIDKMVADKLLTGEDGELAKQLIKDEKIKTVSEDIDYYISSGDSSSLTTLLEESYNGGNGIIDLDTYQDGYFRFSLQNCEKASASEVLQVEADLKNLMDAGKISEADYGAAVSYLYASQGGKLDPSSYTVNIDKKGNKTVVMGNKSYAFKEGKEIPTTDDISKILTGIAADDLWNDRLVMYEGTLYNYSGVPRRWHEVVSSDKGLKETYNKLVGYQPKPAVPKHTPSVTYEESSASEEYKRNL